jgi:hypothetical protein
MIEMNFKTKHVRGMGLTELQLNFIPGQESNNKIQQLLSYFGADDQRPVTVAVDDGEGWSGVLDFSPLKIMARATQQKT